MSTTSKITPEALEEMRATVRAKKEKREEVQRANDRRRCVALNECSRIYNKLLPLLYAEAAKGIKLKNDGSVTKKDKERIDQLIQDNLLMPCHVFWKITSSGCFSLDIKRHWDQESDTGGQPCGRSAEVGGYCFIPSSTGNHAPLESMEVMKTDRTAEAVAAARVRLVELQQQAADLNSLINATSRIISC